MTIDVEDASTIRVSVLADDLRVHASDASSVSLRDLDARQTSVDLTDASQMEARVREAVTGSASDASRLVLVGPAPRTDVETSDGSSVSTGR